MGFIIYQLFFFSRIASILVVFVVWLLLAENIFQFKMNTTGSSYTIQRL